MQTELVQIQPTFKTDLLESVEVFKNDAIDFTDDYETVGVIQMRSTYWILYWYLTVFHRNIISRLSFVFVSPNGLLC